jgi:hypothetical protein
MSFIDKFNIARVCGNAFTREIRLSSEVLGHVNEETRIWNLIEH